MLTVRRVVHEGLQLARFEHAFVYLVDTMCDRGLELSSRTSFVYRSALPRSGPLFQATETYNDIINLAATAYKVRSIQMVQVVLCGGFLSPVAFTTAHVVVLLLNASAAFSGIKLIKALVSHMSISAGRASSF